MDSSGECGTSAGAGVDRFVGLDAERGRDGSTGLVKNVEGFVMLMLE
jgi:hypothetical protein